MADKTNYTTNPNANDDILLHETDSYEDMVYIGALRKAVGLPFDANIFDEDFLRYTRMTAGGDEGEPFSNEFAEGEANMYAESMTDSFNDVVNPLSGTIKAVGMMKYEAYAKLGYVPCRYDQFLEFAGILLNNDYGIIDGDDKGRVKIALANLRREHIFDMTTANKKATVIYLHNNGYEFKENVPGLTSMDCEAIIRGIEKVNSQAGKEKIGKKG